MTRGIASVRRQFKRWARKRGIVRTANQEFRNLLLLRDPRFIHPPRKHQRNWVLAKAIREFTDDLYHWHEATQRFLRGAPRTRIQEDWDTSTAHYEDGQLLIASQQVMQDWERPIMEAMARIIACGHGDVLEVGFGMGISASYVQQIGVRSHTIIECNENVLAEAKKWREQHPDRDIRLVYGRWQEVLDQSQECDGILFDTYATTEKELYGLPVYEAFFPVGARLLRGGGAFTYFASEIDSLNRRTQRLLLRHFDSVTVSVVKSLSPPEDCQYCWTDSMVVVKASKLAAGSGTHSDR